jgi:hypothetical protein
MHTLLKTRSKAASPSSHVGMVPSLLTSSLSRVRSYSCSSTSTADITAALGGVEGQHQPISNDQLYNKKQAQETIVMD